MLPQWTVTNNASLGILQERLQIQIALPLASTNGLTTSVISGSLPQGLRLVNNEIIGTPFEVARPTASKFVIRATTSEGISDRTFTIVVEGEDLPVWVTNEGRLPIGPNGVYFILDSSLIDFQLIATDSDLPAGDTIGYYIADGDGELPPGITLSLDGKLSGQVEPLLSLEINVSNGGFDSDSFSTIPYDFSIPSNNGLDTYLYDATTYDFSIPTKRPRKLNRLHEFYVTATDNVTEIKRKFQIYVVGDDFVRSDNTLMKAADGVFTADATYLRNPYWLTNADLGLRRANNYTTIFLETLDQGLTSGVINYLLQPINIDGSLSELPPGLVLDESTGELAGIIPYQPAVTREYNFTVNAIRNDADMGIVTVFATFYEDAMTGSVGIKIAKLPRTLTDGLDDLQSLIAREIPIEGRYYTVSSVDGANPEYDIIYLTEGLAPMLNRAPLSLIKDALAGSDYFFISPLPNNDVSFYLDKTLSFSSTELHKIESISDYIEYRITIEDSSSDIELNTDITGSTGTVQETLESFLEFNGYSAYIDTISGNSGIIEIIMHIPSTAQTRNINYIKSLFHTSDSAEVFVEVLGQDQQVVVDETLDRNLNVSRQLSFGGVIGTFFSKSFPRAEIDIIESPRQFTLNLLGEVDSAITWVTPSDLGLLAANRLSTLSVNANTTLPNAVVKYYITSGSLPNGLEFKDTGEITGKVPVFGTDIALGLTFFDNGETTFDGATTSLDREYTFTVLAKDRFGYSATSRTFTIKIDDDDSLTYSNIYMRPFLKTLEKQSFLSIINASSLIDPSFVYRPSDPNFGVQRDLKSLVYAGIQTQNISAFVSAAAKNHKRKRYNIGELKTAVAKAPGTNDIIYEVVYLELKDPATPVSGKTQSSFKILNGSARITTDSIKYESQDDLFAGRDGSISIPISLPDGTIINLDLFGSTLTVQTRSDTVEELYNSNGFIEITLRSAEVIKLSATIVSGVTSDGSPWRWRPKTNTITADSDAIQIDQNSDTKKYISNIDNMRENIKTMKLDDSTRAASSRDFLPLWMRTPQNSSLSDLGYVLAIPLAYTLPGYSNTVKANIENNGYDFKTINYDIDRYIIDTTSGNSNEQYIIFANYQFNV